MSGENKELEAARKKVNTDLVVVDAAKITCNYASGTKRNLLRVEEGHAPMHDGKLYAHDGNCIPIENIDPFKYCTAPDVGEKLKILSKTTTGDIKERCKNALTNAVRIRYGQVVSWPCAVPLLDRWFDADESELVKGIFKLDATIEKRVKKMANATKDRAYKAYARVIELKYGDDGKYLDKDGLDANISKGDKLKEISEKIGEKKVDVQKVLNTKIKPEWEDFSVVVEQLDEAYKYVLDIRTLWKRAYRLYKGLKDYETYVEECDSILELIQSEKDKITKLDEVEFHLITTESFLVCRCGGIITIEDSGQTYQSERNRSINNILSLVTQFKEYCMHYSSKDTCPTYYDTPDEYGFVSYDRAGDALTYLETMMAGGAIEADDLKVAVYLELTFHSFNENIQNKLMGMLGLLSLHPSFSWLAIFLACYTLHSSDVKDDRDSAKITLLDAIKLKKNKGKGLIASSTLGDGVVQINNGYTAFTSILSFMYISYATWVEKVKITIFTTDHAHILERGIKENGELLGDENDIQIYSQEEYKGGDINRRIKWNQDPAVYLKEYLDMKDWLENKSETVRNVDEMMDGE